ncbi:MAG: peptide ABC transporter ATP-binding protein, partial [Gammaproteobacteria bacterium]|nr:peptide ABC transporter ATP-binding protein [Gammaproteobacteria bacterium]
LSPPSGCRFHPRCPSCLSICSQHAPETVTIAPIHTVACHLHDQ